MCTKLTKKTIVALASMMLACFVSIADENPYTVQYTVNGYAGTEVLTNFPVLVRLAADSPLGFSYADCAEGGADLTFKDDGGNVIPREIDTWNTSDESLVWVCVPVVTNGASFTMHYGNTSVAAQPTCQTDGSVWSNANYNAVWHFASSNKESVHDLSATVSGTTAYKNDGTYPTVMGGNALWLSNNGYLRYANSADWTTLGDGNTLTLSCWAISQNPGYGRMISCKTNWNDAIGYELTTQNSDTTITIGTLGESQQQFSGVPSVKSWRHITATYSSNGTLSLWVDGLSKGSASKSALTTPTAALTLGANSGTGNYWPGGLDEVRIHRGVESGDWIKACYDTMSSGTFLTAGARQSTVNPDLSTSYLLVDLGAVSVSATIDSIGEGAASCDLYFAYAPAGDVLPDWTLVAPGLTAGDSHTRKLAGLVENTTYDYAFMASNNCEKTTVKSGTFFAGIGFPRPDKNVAEFSRGAKFTVTGYTGTQELTNFPVLVRLSQGSPTGFSYADFYNPGDVPGADLCFLDAAGNGIPHEIDTWDPTGESLVWVTLPRMVNGTEFSMWYRSSKNGSVVCADNAWEDYTGVWHLGEGGDGVQTVHDSTANDLAGVTHANSSAQAEGRIGGSRRVSTKGGASDANGRILVDLSDADKRAAVDALAATGSDKTFTASLWLRPRGGTDYAYIISRKTDDKYPAWGVQFNVNSSGWYNQMRVYSAGTADNQSAAFGVTSTASGVWRKIDIVWTKTTYTVYYDGGGSGKKWTGSLNSSNGQEPLNGSSDLSFGGNTSSGYGSLNGELDEVRLRRGSMGDDWVKADYDTLINPRDMARMKNIEDLIEMQVPRLPLPEGLGDGPAWNPDTKGGRKPNGRRNSHHRGNGGRRGGNVRRNPKNTGDARKK